MLRWSKLSEVSSPSFPVWTYIWESKTAYNAHRKWSNSEMEHRLGTDCIWKWTWFWSFVNKQNFDHSWFVVTSNELFMNFQLLIVTFTNNISRSQNFRKRWRAFMMKVEPCIRLSHWAYCGFSRSDVKFGQIRYCNTDVLKHVTKFSSLNHILGR